MARPLAITVVLLPAALLSCRVGPEYEGPPEVELPAAYGELDNPAFEAGQSDLRTWWEVFDDPLLNELIERAAENNKDLLIAAARVDEAWARTGVVRGELRPQIGADAGISRRDDANTGFEVRTLRTMGTAASWALDVFGRLRRQVEVAEALYEASAQDVHDVQVLLFSAVASSYVSVRSLQAQIEASLDNIESQENVQQLTETRFRDGIASGLDVAQARQVLATTEADVPTLRIQLASEINSIATLLGTHPQVLQELLSEAGPIPVPPETVVVGLPADLLRQRPDLRSAERRLAAQAARVGVAVADLYPSFSLDGAFGYSSLDGNTVIEKDSRFFSIGPSVRWNIFAGGSLRSQIEVEDALLEQTMLQYEQAVLLAIQEAETAMTAFVQQSLRVEATERAAEASRETLDLATRLYTEGLSNFQSVLDAQREQLQTESSAAAARGGAAQSLVFLYSALGGGWDPDALEPDASAVPAQSSEPEPDKP